MCLSCDEQRALPVIIGTLHCCVTEKQPSGPTPKGKPVANQKAPSRSSTKGPTPKQPPSGSTASTQQGLARKNESKPRQRPPVITGTDSEIANGESPEKGRQPQPHVMSIEEAKAGLMRELSDEESKYGDLGTGKFFIRSN